MLGLPNESDADVDELIAFTKEMASMSRISLGISPFVAKRNTPLDKTPFAGIKKPLSKRIKRLNKGLRGRAQIRPTSARWAGGICVGPGDEAEGIALMEAVHRGGDSLTISVRFLLYRQHDLPTKATWAYF